MLINASAVTIVILYGLLIWVWMWFDNAGRMTEVGTIVVNDNNIYMADSANTYPLAYPRVSLCL